MCLLNYQPGTNEAASITTPLHPSRPTCTDLEQQLLVPRSFWLHLPPWERGKPEGHPGTDCSSKRWSEVRTGPSASQSFFSLFSLTKTQTGIFLTQGSNPCLLPCRWILYPLSLWGSPHLNLITFQRFCLRIPSHCRRSRCGGQVFRAPTWILGDANFQVTADCMREIFLIFIFLVKS